MAEQERNVRLALYDSSGKLLGYKSDTFWTLDNKEYAKIHSRNEAQPDAHLAKNFTAILNSRELVWRGYNKRKLEEVGFSGRKKTLNIVVEDAGNGEKLESFKITFNNGRRRYEISKSSR